MLSECPGCAAMASISGTSWINWPPQALLCDLRQTQCLEQQMSGRRSCVPHHRYHLILWTCWTDVIVGSAFVEHCNAYSLLFETGHG